MKKESIDERLQILKAEHPPGYTGSPVAPLSHRTENDHTVTFNVAKHQVDVFRRTKQGDALFEFLEGKESMTHTYYWGNNPKRKSLKGRKCRIIAAGKMNSIQIEFENGQMECVSRRAVRRIK